MVQSFIDCQNDRVYRGPRGKSFHFKPGRLRAPVQRMVMPNHGLPESFHSMLDSTIPQVPDAQ
jgi:hypothetical protein